MSTRRLAPERSWEIRAPWDIVVSPRVRLPDAWRDAVRLYEICRARAEALRPLMDWDGHLQPSL